MKIKVLKLKNWQVFIPLLIIYVIWILMSIYEFEVGLFTEKEFKALFGALGVFYIFGWILWIGLELNNKNGNPYHFSSVLIILSALIPMLLYAQLHSLSSTLINFEFPQTISFVMPFLTFISLVYLLRNVSKSINSLEKQKVAKFSDYIGDMFLIFIAPIGIWIIQPRLNKINNR